ncbi:Ni/Fe-hydrogenase, b-type cytochrome subunit [Candidatus Methylospira mobilis]|uniref:Ni/Fe-hydrogenase, b-type cytochrome subunit n=1 Tax=Candidatus Methylospira mobilis TaxID=1808979 RepID=UPI0028ECC84C|nr:Ni/Fe-hydrogenase, b-type cytochrome subunit [Candidatus Methylospira mobilis]WNV05631.1 Ni/Fe-hydrogenase, b-type cytochrome subunit [Candidatus Methylospira mobilis]
MSAISPLDKPVYVYELPVRLWHGVNALALVVLAITGYLIASPPVVSVYDEASQHFLLGNIRFAHFSAGYVLALGFIGRVYWAFVGNEYARQLFVPEVYKLKWWDDLWHEVLWYLFLVKEPRKHIGHNPLAGLALFMFYVLGALFMIVTGFALYGEGLGQGSWADRLFGWVIPLLGQSQGAHTWHHVGMWYLVVFTMTHIYVAVRENLMSRQSLLSTMKDGWRRWKDDRP